VIAGMSVRPDGLLYIGPRCDTKTRCEQMRARVAKFIKMGLRLQTKWRKALASIPAFKEAP